MNEPVARNLYKEQTLEKGYQVNSSGLNVSYEYPYIGCSPDDIVDTPVEGRGLVEYKCAYTGRDIVLDEYVKLKDSFLAEYDNGYRLRRNNDYYYQVIGSLGVLGLDWCDFVVYLPKSGLFIERINFDF